MCGIAGVFDLVSDRAIDRAVLQRMADALRHRGPDGEGFFNAPGVGFAHRRLAIIDIEGGAQPLSAASGSAITFNGEIYNYKDLAAAHQARGVRLKTRSDTEVLAEGLDREGGRYVEKLRGMFAFGFWNARDKSLTLARDRIGERPLYYASTPDGLLVFASEIGAIVASGLVELKLDREAVADYFLYGFTPDPKSIYAGVRKLPPGTLLFAGRGAASRQEHYWRPEFRAGVAEAPAHSTERLLELLDDAVRAQMISDVPLGAFLSGGVDSSAIVSAMALAGNKVKTCTIGFAEDAFDEREHARAVSALYSTEHMEEVASLDAASMIDTIARTYGEPFADASALPTYIVSQLARKRVTVALSGDGGDEVFAGYRRYPFFVNEERVRALAPLALRQATFGAAGALYPKLDWAPRPVRLKTTLQSLGKSRAVGYAHAIAANLPDRIDKILSRDFKASLGGYAPESVVADAMGDASEHPLLAAQRADFATWLPGRMLTKVDRASMAHGLEVRPPLLDHRLVEWAGGLHPSLKLDGGEGKRILKSALEQRLPRDILYRKKQGFALPVSDWLRREGGPLERLSSSGRWRDSGILDANAIEAMMAAHKRGSSDCGQELWTVLMFDAFLGQM
ncbi:MAG: asparagine synthase (glutamine-hydrolyzing) [Parvularculaceae bacterium]